MRWLPKIALRNVIRNRRRSTATVLTIAMGAIALLLFGSFTRYVVLSYQTSTVERIGHIALFKRGYTQYGAGDVSAYGIGDYDRILAALRADPELAPLLSVVTKTQVVFGVAGNFAAGASKPFFGVGVIPDDYDRMQRWNAYGIPDFDQRRSWIDARDPNSGIVGIGLGRVLGLCEELHIYGCAPRPRAAADTAGPREDFSDLAALDAPVVAPAQAKPVMPRIDLLASTANGAPNVVSINVAHAQFQGVKDIDDSYVAMHLALAQRLVYGRGTPEVTSIVIQLRRTEDLNRAMVALRRLIATRGFDLEFRDFRDLAPLYVQTTSFFGVTFGFVATILGVIVLFSVINTMGMNVIERTSEIGTLRALGIHRREVGAQFVLEGGILGMAGATIGLVVAGLIALAVNASSLTWTPPGAAGQVPLKLYYFGYPELLAGTWCGLVAVVVVASLLPARRAARLPITDALRHV